MTQDPTEEADNGIGIDRLSKQVLPWFLIDGNSAIESYRGADHYVVLDFETTNLQNGLAVFPDNRLVLAVWYVVKDGTVTKKYKFGDEYQQGELLEDIKDARFVVAHNAKFEVQWLMWCGVDPRDLLVYDSMAAEWVIAGNRKWLLNLNDTAARYELPAKQTLVSKLIGLGVCPSRIPRSWLLDYCDKDVALCMDVFLAQKRLLDNLDLWHIVLQRNLVVPVLADIETKGLQLDKQKVYDEYERLKQVVYEYGEQLDALTGGINLGSPKQLGEFLYGTLGFSAPLDNAGNPIKTEGGQISTAAPALERLVATTPDQETFLKLYKEYNLADSMLSKNMTFFKLVCDQQGGVFYGQLRQGRTANHRLASSGIPTLFTGMKKAIAAQIQNLPRRYKSLFTAHKDGWVVTEYDGSQIEFRVAADEGHDKQAESDIVNGVDIHSFTRDTMNEAYQRNKIDKFIDRQAAKAQTFAPLFGAFGKDAAEQEYTKTFREKYKAIYHTQQDWALTVADRKKLVTPYGLTFYWPSAIMHRSGYVSFSTEIFNLPISGLATGEIIPLALVFFWHRTRGLAVEIFNTVHDSIVVRQREEIQDEVTQIAKQSMTYDVYEFLREVYKYSVKVPLGFGMKSSKNWGDSKTEHKWDVWPQGWERYQIEENKQTRVVYDTRESINGETN